MYSYGGTKRRHRRGGLDKSSEDSFLKKDAEKRRAELIGLGDRLSQPAQVLEGVGTETKKSKVSLFQQRQTELARAKREGKEPPSAGGRRRRRKTRRHRR